MRCSRQLGRTVFVLCSQPKLGKVEALGTRNDSKIAKQELSGTEKYSDLSVDFNNGRPLKCHSPDGTHRPSHPHRHTFGCQIPYSRWREILWLQSLQLLSDFSEKSGFCLHSFITWSQSCNAAPLTGSFTQFAGDLLPAMCSIGQITGFCSLIIWWAESSPPPPFWHF